MRNIVLAIICCVAAGSQASLARVVQPAPVIVTSDAAAAASIRLATPASWRLAPTKERSQSPLLLRTTPTTLAQSP
jgi:hypothetical protein